MALSFDRVMALWYPVYYYQNAKKSTAVITSIAIHVVIALVFLPLWSWFQIQDNICTLSNFDLLNEQVSYVILLVYTFVLSMALPVVCIVVSNALVIYKLRNRMSVMSERDREISVALVLASATFTVIIVASLLTVHFQHNSTNVDASTKNLMGKLKVIMFWLVKKITG